MGYTCHHTLVVASNGPDLERAHAHATEIFRWVSPISPPAGNGSRAFFVPPDGSKEGMPGSEDGDARRGDFISWLETETPELDWCEVAFGDDSGQDRLFRSNQVDKREPREIERTKPSADKRDYVKCACGHAFVVYTYEPQGEFEGAVIISGYEEEAGVFCEACETVYELRPGLGWVPEGTPVAELGNRSRLAGLGE